MDNREIRSKVKLQWYPIIRLRLLLYYLLSLLSSQNEVITNNRR